MKPRTIAGVLALAGGLGGQASTQTPAKITQADSQPNPGVARAQARKALDGNPYVLLGPGYSGSVKVTSSLAQQAGIPADHGRPGGQRGLDSDDRADRLPSVLPNAASRGDLVRAVS